MVTPIMQIEVWENGVWVPLDDLQSMIRPRFRELQAFMS